MADGDFIKVSVDKARIKLWEVTAVNVLLQVLGGPFSSVSELRRVYSLAPRVFARRVTSVFRAVFYPCARSALLTLIDAATLADRKPLPHLPPDLESAAALTLRRSLAASLLGKGSNPQSESGQTLMQQLMSPAVMIDWFLSLRVVVVAAVYSLASSDIHVEEHSIESLLPFAKEVVSKWPLDPAAYSAVLRLPMYGVECADKASRLLADTTAAVVSQNSDDAIAESLFERVDVIVSHTHAVAINSFLIGRLQPAFGASEAAALDEGEEIPSDSWDPRPMTSVEPKLLATDKALSGMAEILADLVPMVLSRPLKVLVEELAGLGASLHAAVVSTPRCTSADISNAIASETVCESMASAVVVSELVDKLSNVAPCAFKNFADGFASALLSSPWVSLFERPTCRLAKRSSGDISGTAMEFAESLKCTWGIADNLLRPTFHAIFGALPWDSLADVISMRGCLSGRSLADCEEAFHRILLKSFDAALPDLAVALDSTRSPILPMRSAIMRCLAFFLDIVPTLALLPACIQASALAANPSYKLDSDEFDVACTSSLLPEGADISITTFFAVIKSSCFEFIADLMLITAAHGLLTHKLAPGVPQYSQISAAVALCPFPPSWFVHATSVDFIAGVLKGFISFESWKMEFFTAIDTIVMPLLPQVQWSSVSSLESLSSFLPVAPASEKTSPTAKSGWSRLRELAFGNGKNVLPAPKDSSSDSDDSSISKTSKAPKPKKKAATRSRANSSRVSSATGLRSRIGSAAGARKGGRGRGGSRIRKLEASSPRKDSGIDVLDDLTALTRDMSGVFEQPGQILPSSKLHNEQRETEPLSVEDGSFAAASQSLAAPATSASTGGDLNVGLSIGSVAVSCFNLGLPEPFFRTAVGIVDPRTLKVGGVGIGKLVCSVEAARSAILSEVFNFILVAEPNCNIPHDVLRQASGVLFCSEEDLVRFAAEVSQMGLSKTPAFAFAPPLLDGSCPLPREIIPFVDPDESSGDTAVASDKLTMAVKLGSSWIPEGVWVVLHSVAMGLYLLRDMGSGLPSSPGVGVGRMFVAEHDAKQLSKSGHPILQVLLGRTGTSSNFVASSVGVVQSEGGTADMLSYAARQRGVPCASCVSSVIPISNRIVCVNGKQMKVGSWITVNGYTGGVGILSSSLPGMRFMQSRIKDQRLALPLTVLSSISWPFTDPPRSSRTLSRNVSINMGTADNPTGILRSALLQMNPPHAVPVVETVLQHTTTEEERQVENSSSNSRHCESSLPAVPKLGKPSQTKPVISSVNGGDQVALPPI